MKIPPFLTIYKERIYGPSLAFEAQPSSPKKTELEYWNKATIATNGKATIECLTGESETEMDAFCGGGWWLASWLSGWWLRFGIYNYQNILISTRFVS